MKLFGIKFNDFRHGMKIARIRAAHHLERIEARVPGSTWDYIKARNQEDLFRVLAEGHERRNGK